MASFPTAFAHTKWLPRMVQVSDALIQNPKERVRLERSDQYQRRKADRHLNHQKSFPNGKRFENEASEGPDLGFIVGSSAVTEDFWETVSLYSVRISCCDKCLWCGIHDFPTPIIVILDYTATTITPNNSQIAKPAKGFKSPWTVPFSWIYFNPFVICVARSNLSRQNLTYCSSLARHTSFKIYTASVPHNTPYQ